MSTVNIDKFSGSVKFFNKEKSFGFIIQSDGTDIFFRGTSFTGDINACESGLLVAFSIRTNAKGTEAYDVAAYQTQQPASHIPVPQSNVASGETQNLAELDSIMQNREYNPGRKLTTWSRIVIDEIKIYRPKEARDGSISDEVDHIIASHIPSLADIALKETWCFNNDRDNLSILKNYVKYTFYRLAREKKIAFSGEYAVFNTGLVDNLYEPIFGLFRLRKNIDASAKDQRSYDFIDWCVAGNGPTGKQLMKEFSLRPAAAAYFTKISDVIFDDKLNLTTQWEHVLDDGISRGRFPLEFLHANTPRGFEWNTEISAKNNLETYVGALQQDSQRRRQIKNRLDDAIQLARKRASWNYKTAIPSYYPRENTMSILLPLALTDDNVVDLALVVEKANEREYYGATVYPLDMAYKGARLVCRPDSDWLKPDINEGSADDDELA